MGTAVTALTFEQHVAKGVTRGTTTRPDKLKVLGGQGLLAIVKWPGASLYNPLGSVWVPGDVRVYWAKLNSDGPPTWSYERKRTIWDVRDNGRVTPRIARQLVQCLLANHIRALFSVHRQRHTAIVACSGPREADDDPMIPRDVFDELVRRGLLVKFGKPRKLFADAPKGGLEIQKWRFDRERICDAR